MKKLVIVLLVLFSNLNNDLSAQWQSVGGQARDVGVGANGTVWVIGWTAVPGGYNIARWNGNFWEDIPGGAVRIDVDPNGNAWVVNDAGFIFRWNGQTWQNIGGQARDVGIGADGTVWVIGWTAVPGGYNIARWNGNFWEEVPGGAVRIDVDQNGRAWVVNDAGAIFRWNGQYWEVIGGQGRDISISADGTPWLIGWVGTPGGYFVYRWNGSTWLDVPGGLTNINAGRNEVWGVNDGGIIWRQKISSIVNWNGGGGIVKPIDSGVSTSISRNNETRLPTYGNARKKEENGMSCTSRRVEFTESNFERIITGGIWDKLYPGAIYNAQSVADGRFTTIDIPRNPMTIAVNLVSASSGILSRTLPANGINRSSVWQNISSLLNSNRNVINAARASFEMKQIHSSEQLKVFVGGDFSGWGASVQATFNSSSSQSRNVYLVKVTQVYFDVTVDDNQQLVGNLPSEEAVYVHSVSYGKIGYLRVESSESEQTIAAALNARYNWGTGNAGIQANIDYNKVLRESQTVGFVVGGAPRIISGPQQMNEFVSDVRWNPSVQIMPISYKLKFLKDRADAYVNMATSYTERICEPIRRGNTLKVTTQSGTGELRNYNTAFITVNFNNGTSTAEKLLHRGLGQNQSATQNITLDQEIDLVNVSSISIRHDGAPNNNPFNGGDAFHTYNNWTLMTLRVSLITNNGQEINIYNSNSRASEGDSAPVQFSGEKRIAVFKRQL
jgi:hypothetical protein